MRHTLAIIDHSLISDVYMFNPRAHAQLAMYHAALPRIVVLGGGQSGWWSSQINLFNVTISEPYYTTELRCTIH